MIYVVVAPVAIAGAVLLLATKYHKLYVAPKLEELIALSKKPKRSILRTVIRESASQVAPLSFFPNGKDIAPDKDKLQKIISELNETY